MVRSQAAMKGILAVLPLPRRLREAGWGVLLVPVALLVAGIFGKGITWGITAAAAAAAALLVPAVAADLAAAGTVCLGLYAAVLTGWMILAFYGVTANPFYNGASLVGLNPFSSVFLASGGSGVLLDVVTSTLLLGFGVWLVPRTIGVHSGLVKRNAALAGRVTRLTETRGTDFEYKFYSYYMSSLAPDRLLVTPIIGPTTPSTPGWPLTAEQEATAVAELQQAAAGWAALLAECAGLALGYGEHQPGAARYRHIAELCVTAGVDQTLVEAWIEVGRQRASTAAVTTHKACVLWDS